MPALSFHFGLKWSDLKTMPAGELAEYLDALAQIQGR